jgi:hypothetical protein
MKEAWNYCTENCQSETQHDPQQYKVPGRHFSFLEGDIENCNDNNNGDCRCRDFFPTGMPYILSLSSYRPDLRMAFHGWSSVFLLLFLSLFRRVQISI